MSTEGKADAGSKFQVQTQQSCWFKDMSILAMIHDFCRDSVKLIQASLTLTAPNYVLLGHDFCRDST